MLTDSLPQKALLRAAYLKSDQLCSLEVPADDRLRAPARSIEEALNNPRARVSHGAERETTACQARSETPLHGRQCLRWQRSPSAASALARNLARGPNPLYSPSFAALFSLNKLPSRI